MESRASQTWFEALSAEVDGLLIIDKELQVLQASPTVAQLFGRLENHFLQSDLKDSFPLLANALHSQEQFPATLVIPASEGNQLPTELELHCSEIIFDEKKGYSIAIRKKSESAHFQKELQTIHSEFESVFTKAIDAIIFINQRGIIQKANPATSSLFGYALEEMTGQNVSMLMPSPHRQQHDQYLKNYLTSGIAKIIGIGRRVDGLRKDGSTFPMRLAVNEVKIATESVFTGIIQDLTNEKAAEEKIKKLNASLEGKIAQRTAELSRTVSKLLSTNKKMEQVLIQKENITQALKQSEAELKESLRKEKQLGDLKTRFVTTASHEFRTPLSSILSSAEIVQLLLDKRQPEKTQKHLDRITKSVESLTAILEEFLSLSKLEEGVQEANVQNNDLLEIIKESIDNFEPSLKSGQTIEIKYESSTLPIRTDRKILRQVLLNLFSNASKYSSEKSPIICKLQKGTDQVNLSIIDQGIGIPKDDLPHLFTRFFRAKNAINIQGTGLGLNIIKRFLTLINAKIVVESTLGEGSTFMIQLPLNLKKR